MVKKARQEVDGEQSTRQKKHRSYGGSKSVMYLKLDLPSWYKVPSTSDHSHRSWKNSKLLLLLPRLLVSS
jgi:hypothetical protein